MNLRSIKLDHEARRFEGGLPVSAVRPREYTVGVGGIVALLATTFGVEVHVDPALLQPGETLLVPWPRIVDGWIVDDGRAEHAAREAAQISELERAQQEAIEQRTATDEAMRRQAELIGSQVREAEAQKKNRGGKR